MRCGSLASRTIPLITRLPSTSISSPITGIIGIYFPGHSFSSSTSTPEIMRHITTRFFILRVSYSPSSGASLSIVPSDKRYISPASFSSTVKYSAIRIVLSSGVSHKRTSSPTVVSASLFTGFLSGYWRLNSSWVKSSVMNIYIASE